MMCGYGRGTSCPSHASLWIMQYTRGGERYWLVICYHRCFTASLKAEPFKGCHRELSMKTID